MGNIHLKQLKVGFNTMCERTDTNTFTITGDITFKAECGDNNPKNKFDIDVDKLQVVYNNDGLLEYVRSAADVSCDAERYFEQTDIEYDTWGYNGLRLNTDGNSINLYADFEMGDDCVY